MLPTNIIEIPDSPIAENNPSHEPKRSYQHLAYFFANQKGKARAKPTARKAPSHIINLEDNPKRPFHASRLFAAAELDQHEQCSIPHSKLYTNPHTRELENKIFYPFAPEAPIFVENQDNGTESPPLTLSEAVNSVGPNTLPRFHVHAPRARPWNQRASQDVIEAWDWSNTTRYQSSNVLDLAERRIYDTTPESWRGFEDKRANIITTAVMLRIARVTWICGYKGFNVSENGGFNVYWVKGEEVRPLPKWMPLAHIEILEGKSWDFMSPQQKAIVEASEAEGPPRYPIEKIWADWNREE